MLRSWEKYININTEENNEGIEDKNIIQKEKEDIDEIYEVIMLMSEDVHGGNEATKDIENSPNPAESGENQQESGAMSCCCSSSDEEHDDNDSSGDGEGEESKEGKNEEIEELEDEENEEGEDEEYEEYEETGIYNKNSLYNEAVKKAYTLKLQRAFAICIAKLAEDLSNNDTDGDDLWDVNALMLRRFTRRNILSCKKSEEKEKIVLALDFSGSCKDYSNFFYRLARLSEKHKDIEIFDASNGFCEEEGYNYSLTNKEDKPFSYFYNRTIIFFGDFDGGASIVRLSKKAKVYWFSCEERYDDLDEHDWCEGYTLKDFKGVYYKCYNEDDFIKLIKKIRII